MDYLGLLNFLPWIIDRLTSRKKLVITGEFRKTQKRTGLPNATLNLRAVNMGHECIFIKYWEIYYNLNNKPWTQIVTPPELKPGQESPFNHYYPPGNNEFANGFQILGIRDQAGHFWSIKRKDLKKINAAVKNPPEIIN